MIGASGPWSILRGLRAEPPGRAATDGARRAVFAAALEQAEQFLTAAGAVGYATKPVQLFYALNQAGRAIAAVHADEPWEIGSHGAGVKSSAEVGATTVEPDKKPRGAMRVVADATGSELWEGPVTVGSLWASLPELPADPDLVGSVDRPLEVELDYFDYRSVPLPSNLAVYTASVPLGVSGYTWRVGLRVENKPTDDEGQSAVAERALAPYPKAAGWSLARGLVTTNVYGGDQTPILVEWIREDESGDRVMTPPQLLTEQYDGKLYFRPGLGRDRAVPSSLITWWGILIALASLARYESVAWRRALDIDNSPIASALEQGLGIAEERIPELVLRAVSA